ncbi:hypothetical protein BDR26DRAFT_853896 [Obelidium mucronatum]|nr:hypothetical protein BDR26DRAFT_853896 [Obelidium mucronatum]
MRVPVAQKCVVISCPILQASFLNSDVYTIDATVTLCSGSNTQCGAPNTVSSGPVSIIGVSGGSVPAAVLAPVSPVSTAAARRLRAAPRSSSSSSSSGAAIGIAVAALLVVAAAGAVVALRRRGQARRAAALQRHLELYPQYPQLAVLHAADAPPPLPPKTSSLASSLEPQQPQSQTKERAPASPSPLASQSPFQRLQTRSSAASITLRNNQPAPPVSLSVLERTPTAASSLSSSESIRSKKSVQSINQRAVAEGLLSTDLHPVYLNTAAPPQPMAPEMYSLAQHQQMQYHQQELYSQQQQQQYAQYHAAYPTSWLLSATISSSCGVPLQQLPAHQQQQYAGHFNQVFGNNS